MNYYFLFLVLKLVQLSRSHSKFAESGHRPDGYADVQMRNISGLIHFWCTMIDGSDYVNSVQTEEDLIGSDWNSTKDAIPVEVAAACHTYR